MKVNPGGDCIWEIPPSEKAGMLVPARIYASETLLKQTDAGVFEQVTSVACLPGIVRAALCMPDGHWGYGFPSGVVAAFRAGHGDHLAGWHRVRHQLRVRLLRTQLTEEEVRPRLTELVEAPGQKLDEARRLGIQTVDERRFRTLVGNAAG